MTAAALPHAAAAALPHAVAAWPSFRAAPPLFGPTPQDRQQWRRFAQRTLLPVLVLALALPFLPRPQALRAVPPAPVPMARLLIEPEARPAPLPPAPRTEVAAQNKPAVVVPEARRPQPSRRAGERDPQSPLASGVGLLALKQQLAQIHGAPVAVQLQPPAAPGRGVGSGQGPGVGAGTEPGLPLRALVTSNAPGTSGGIGHAAFSRDSGGGGLPGRATTLVAGVAGGSGGGGPGGGGGGPGGGGVGVPGARGGAPGSGTAAPAGAAKQGPGQRARRSIEDIKLVFDRNKGAIYALYNRALRDEPTLQGKVVLELHIAPGGEVVACTVLSSELHAAELERKLVARVRQFDFGPKDVEPLVVSWPVDFLPS